MNITNSNSLNVSTADNSTAAINTAKSVNSDNNTKFSDELKSVAKAEDKANKTNENRTVTKENEPKNDAPQNEQKNNKEDGQVDEALNGLNDTIDELNKLNQKEEIEQEALKQKALQDDIIRRQEELALIDNNMNIQETPDKLNLQAGANMNFNSDEQPFAEFVKQDNQKDVLKTSAKDLEEEKSIMSTMEENIAIANKNMAISKNKTVENEHGIQKVDKKSNLVVDTIVNYDRVVMDKADVEFFANLVENGVLNMSDVQGAEKSSRVSKALADLLAKAMNDNKPIRIDFDNNISVIIKIDRAGKISADFLPSSQVAEAYLKENLPLLRQRFDDNNIDYNELNQRQRKQDNQDNRKKERKDE